MIRLISWNLNGRRTCLHEQIDALKQRAPDFIALQEVLMTNVADLKLGLSQIGLKYSLDSFSLAPSRKPLYGPRKYGLILASRWPLISLDPREFQVPWRERVLSGRIGSPFGKIEIHTTGIPPGSTNGWLKVEMFEGIYERLAKTSRFPRILCGDFNTPQAEKSNRQIITWGQDIFSESDVEIWKYWTDRQGIRGKGERWDKAERAILSGLANFDLSDVFRSLNGYQTVESSWHLKRRGKIFKRRYDHIFASRSLNAVKCQYLHSLRKAGLSDHSPIEGEFDPPISGMSKSPS